MIFYYFFREIENYVLICELILFFSKERHVPYLLLRLEAVEEEEEEVLDDPGGGQKAFLEADFRRSLI